MRNRPALGGFFIRGRFSLFLPAWHKKTDTFCDAMGYVFRESSGTGSRASQRLADGIFGFLFGNKSEVLHFGESWISFFCFHY